MAVDKGLAELVTERARHRCEYCRLPQQFVSITFEIDHIVAVQHGGVTAPLNLALACYADNHHKGPNLAGIDPKTGKRAWLFNLRRQKWGRHFRWAGPIILGRTPVGRATVMVLRMNEPHRVAQRAALMLECVFPARLAACPPPPERTAGFRVEAQLAQALKCHG